MTFGVPLSSGRTAVPRVPDQSIPGAYPAEKGGTSRPSDFECYALLEQESPNRRVRAVSEPFCGLANQLVVTLPRNPERTVALRKLLEAKEVRGEVPEREELQDGLVHHAPFR